MAKEYNTQGFDPKQIAANPFNLFGTRGEDENGNPVRREGWLKSLWNDITGYTSQQREFEQQEYLQDKMNEYNDPVNQMARLTAAGLSPSAAAASVQQSGTESAQAPAVASNAGGVAAGVEALASGAQSAQQTAEQVMSFIKRMKKLDADTEEAFENAGFTRLQSKALATSMKYLDEKEKLGIAQLNANIDQIKASKKLIDAQIEEIKENVEKIKADAALARAQGDLTKALKLEADARTLNIEAQTIYQKWYNGICTTYQIDPKLPVVNNMLTWELMGKNTEPMQEVVFNYDKQTYQAEARYGRADSMFGLIDKGLSILGIDAQLNAARNALEEFQTARTPADRKKAFKKAVKEYKNMLIEALNQIENTDEGSFDWKN